ncbi:hypothetical protein OG394_20465 [Kribbella sp. NBC_01245]|uniref:hypothetical protein n=1 Tax=Kribbella sp. NBC_01245 TaxID=2903578 RepID=UPI002E27DBF3|nr:hypothetical protein [Kribbella sp. NBC_01245]
MTRYEDPTEIVLERSLNNQATNAPGDDFLLDRVQHRIKSRRNAKAVAAGVIAAGATVAVILGVTATLNDPAPPVATNDPTPNIATTGPTQPPATTAEKGWRWESYGPIEVQVPADWGYGGGVGYPPCLITTPQKPQVARPGPVPAIACGPGPIKLPFRADSLTFDAFDRKAGVQQIDHGWVEETRVVAGMKITVFTKDAVLRERILSSARPISGTDQHGCAADHAFVANPSLRPAAGSGLASVGAVESISICRYKLDLEDTVNTHPLRSSAKYTGERAATLIATIIASPTGTGPNGFGTCVDPYGSEMVSMAVRGSTGTQEVFLRFSGCDHNSFDDGRTLWKLTKQNLRPALAEPNKPNQGNAAMLLLN